MQVDIQARHFSLTKALHKHIEKRLRFSLGSRDEQIRRVIVRLSDINGPRGGEDKHCHVQVVLPQLGDVVIEDTEKNMYVAIDRAFDRAGYAVARRLSRQRDNHRSAAMPDFSLLTDEYETTVTKIH
ncbi:MAG: HPF/RaiA family ribosome-associated protein [Gammaproteobacteria bacterium]|nr:HPF/RaiA family ribosome-associated protein [Gammaproteobacteria bacterium]